MHNLFFNDALLISYTNKVKLIISSEGIIDLYTNKKVSGQDIDALFIDDNYIYLCYIDANRILLLIINKYSNEYQAYFYEYSKNKINILNIYLDDVDLILIISDGNIKKSLIFNLVSCKWKVRSYEKSNENIYRVYQNCTIYLLETPGLLK